MATAADSSSSSSSTTATNSPRFRRNSRNLSSPWSHVARGEPEGIPAVAAAPSSPSLPSLSAVTGSPPLNLSDRSPPKAAAVENPPAGPSDSDHGGNGNAAAVTPGKKQAWNRPSNGSIETGPVMGAVSWPPLSEATKASPKSSSSDPPKVPSDGPVSAPPAPAVPSPPLKPATDIPSPSSSTNHAAPARQRSTKRNGGGISNSSPSTNCSGGALANGGPAAPPTSAEMPQIALDKPVGTEPSPRDHTNRNSGNWDQGSRGGGGFSPQSHGGNEHHRGYGGNMRGKNGGGGGPHHNSYGNRRDQDRGTYEWNHRTFGGGRDVQVQQPLPQQRTMTRPYLRPPPPGSGPFITPPPVRPFGGPLSFPDMHPPVYYVPAPPPPESIRSMPFVAPPAMFFGPPDPQLHIMLAKQIDYYFSPENLCKDIYLRQNMDEEGWVPISLIANFNRVKRLTSSIQNSIQFILDTVQSSTVVEVQGDKIRRRNDWMNWLLAPAPNQPQSSTSLNYDNLAAHMRIVGLEEGTSGQNSMRAPACSEVVLSRSSSGEFHSHSQVAIASYGSGSGQSTFQSSSDRSLSARSLGRSDTF